MRSFAFIAVFMALSGCMNRGRSEDRSESVRESKAIEAFPTSYICGRLEIDSRVGSDIVSAADEKGLLNVAFRRLSERLRQLGLPLDSAGDTSGSRFRSGPGREGRCRAAADI